MPNNNDQGGNQGGSGRGFAGMDPEQQRKIASKGGKAAHEKGTAHEFTSEEAQKAGAEGGKASHGGNSRSDSSSSSDNSSGGGMSSNRNDMDTE